MKNKLFLFFSVFILGLAGFYFLTKQHVVQQIQQPVLDQVPTPTVPDIIIKNFSFKEYEKNKTYALIIHATEGQFFQTQDTILCNVISCALLNNNEQIAHIAAGKARIKQSNKDVFLEGPVHGNFKELEMHGADIHYNFSTHTITTQKPVHYQHPHASISAQQSAINIKECSIAMDGIYSEFFTEPHDMQQQR